MLETSLDLHIFWGKVKGEYLKVSTNALKNLLPKFNFCEVGFPAKTIGKVILQSRVDHATHFGRHLMAPTDYIM